MICHIVAAADNHIIGRDGALPWDIPEDMKFFRDQTRDHIVIMGRKTYESIGKPLPKRFNIIITRQQGYTADGASVVDSVESAVSLARKKAPEWGDEIYICGGGEIYRQSMDIVDTIFLTRVHQEVEGNATYPEVDITVFSEVARDARVETIPFSFVTYKRR